MKIASIAVTVIFISSCYTHNEITSEDLIKYKIAVEYLMTNSVAFNFFDEYEPQKLLQNLQIGNY